MPQLGPDVAVLVSDEFFSTRHAQLRCVECHGGVEPATGRRDAHVGMDPLPSSAGKDSICFDCHAGIVSRFDGTLHAQTRAISGHGEALVLERAGSDTREALLPAIDRQCDRCHVTGCGDCHVSRPQQVDGGFINGHVFNKTPSSTLNCTGCHGSRVEREYLGKGETDVCELAADVHWDPGEMECVACHTGMWMHGQTTPFDARYDNPSPPRCEMCHDASAQFMGIESHDAHARADAGVYLQCQVCHAQDYNNCVSCHVGESEDGTAYYVNSGSYFDLKIGRNYLKSEEKPWDYVVVRRIPVAPDTFDGYVEDALTEFDAAPTYKYATPHSIARVTRQSESCAACHYDDSVFLTAADIAEMSAEERRANAPVIVDR